MSPLTVAALALVLGALGCWLLAGLGRAAAKPAPVVPAQRAPALGRFSCEVNPLAVGDEFRAYLDGACLVAETEAWLAKASKEEM